MGKLDGQTALVTGAGRGIGRCIALKLAAEGASVVVNDLDADPAAEVVAAIESAGGSAAGCAGNVCDNDFPDRLVATAVDTFGGVDIVVNNAGYTWDNVIQKMTDDQFRAVLDVHLVAPFRILRAAMVPMRAAAEREKAEGSVTHRKVVNISSTSGVFGNAGQSNYAAGKAGIVGLTKTLAKEWGRYSINVNAVAFGLIHTRLTQPLQGDTATIDVDGKTLNVGVQQSHLDAAQKLIPFGRGGYPEEAGGAVYLFCIPESNFVTGQVLVCDGGRV